MCQTKACGPETDLVNVLSGPQEHIFNLLELDCQFLTNRVFIAFILLKKIAYSVQTSLDIDNVETKKFRFNLSVIFNLMGTKIIGPLT